MQNNTRVVKITTAYYLYHPDFIDNGDGTYQTLPTGRWVAEWTVKEKNNPILEHYTKSCQTSAEACDIINRVTKSDGVSGDFMPYRMVNKDDDMFVLGQLKCYIDIRKKLPRKTTVADKF